MRLILSLSVGLLPLAACNSQPSVTAKNASAKEVGDKIAAATGNGDLMSPGRWEGTITMKSVEMPGLTADQQKMMAGKMGQAEPMITCVTPEDAKARRAFFTGDEMKTCKYDTFTMAGGKLDAKVTCSVEGNKMTATMNGAYSPDTYNLEITSDMANMGTSGSMKSTMAIAAKRVGDCRGDERKSG